jgi:hypothetical protein
MLLHLSGPQCMLAGSSAVPVKQDGSGLQVSLHLTAAVVCRAFTCFCTIGGGGGLLHVDMFAHNKSGIAYRDGNRRSKPVVNHKREPHQQPRLLPSCTN